MKDMLVLIKKTGAVRDFKDKVLPNHLLEKILEAGRWGPSILGIQPWRLVCITNFDLINKIAKAVFQKSEEINKPFSSVLKWTSNTIRRAKALIVVYNSGEVAKRAKKYGEPYFTKARMAELQDIGGVIQNMVLEASSLGLGSAWLDSPTFFNEKYINYILRQNSEILAILALGYPSAIPQRSRRREYTQAVEIIK